MRFLVRILWGSLDGIMRFLIRILADAPQNPCQGEDHFVKMKVFHSLFNQYNGPAPCAKA